MAVRLYLNRFFGRPARTLAVGLVLLAMTLLAACTDDEDTQPTAEQPAATSGATSAAAPAPERLRSPPGRRSRW